MDCIAHRGFAGVNPENTLAAVRAAVAADADAVEVDVRRCGSGELVAIHDRTVDRVTAASGPVDSFDATQLRALSVAGSGEGVPTVDAICRALPASTGLVLDIKERDIAHKAVEIARRHDCPLLVSSRSPEVLVGLRGTRCAHILQRGSDLTPPEIAELGCTAVHPHWSLCTDSFLTAARACDLAVNVWTVDSGTVATELAAAGVDGLIADTPACYRQP